MRNAWPRTVATPPDPLDEAVLGSRVLGSHADLVLHGGGNSSIKATAGDATGTPTHVLFVKGSGGDLATMQRQGFAPLRLNRVRDLLDAPALTDTALAGELRLASIDPAAPAPSIEAPLHALLPHTAVLHSHADAVVALTDQPDGQAQAQAVLGDDALVVDYVKPGIDLARAVRRAWDTRRTEPSGIVLVRHGLFTFGDTMKQAYSRHVELVSRVEAALGRPSPPSTTAPHDLDRTATSRLAALRRDVSAAAGRPMIAVRDLGPRAAAFVTREDLSSIATRGPATPDHVIRTKPVPMIGTDVASYCDAYRAYFRRHHDRNGLSAMLDPAPRFALDPRLGLVSFGASVPDAHAVRDIALHTFDIIEAAERYGEYRPLEEADIFDIEYWELEQAKLRSAQAPPPLAGQVAVVTGAASGIGRACAQELLGLGAAVVGIDISPAVTGTFPGPSFLGVRADVGDRQALAAAVDEAVGTFGGIDVLVMAAGIFAQSAPIATLDPDVWDKAFAVNVSGAQSLLALAHPVLQQSPVDPRVVVIGSKNVAAPGPGAAAYSASKAALAQLARVAALEWAADGIRVNTVHPDAVFDTALWSDELLAERARKYGVSVEEYKRRNLLSTTVTSRQVAQAVAALCTEAFAATTGAQIPVDGGNDRVV